MDIVIKPAASGLSYKEQVAQLVSRHGTPVGAGKGPAGLAARGTENKVTLARDGTSESMAECRLLVPIALPFLASRQNGALDA